MKILAGVVERVAPRRPFAHGILNRWSGNVALLAANVAIVGALFPAGASVGAAFLAEEHGIGLFAYLALPSALEIAVSLVVLDFFMWFQHWLQHRVPLLWRSHRVHHTDLDLDFTTSLRFHPFEAVYTMLWRVGAVLLLGLPISGVVLYEVALNVSSTLSHASLRIPARLDALLRTLFVTPDVHRVHHSARSPETDRNFASVLSVWDRIFGTYLAQPEKGHLDMELGLPEHRGSLHALALLALPFRSSQGR